MTQSFQLALPAPDYRAIDQPFLFSPEIVKQMTAAETRGEYTAERLRLRKPELYSAVVQLLGLDWGHKRIARLLGLDHRTVGAVEDAEPAAVKDERTRMTRRLRRVAGLLLERLEAHPDLVPINVAGLVIGQLIDKAELLDGRATVRSERVERIDIYADWQEFVEKQLPADSVQELEDSIPPSGIGSVGREKLANSDGAASCDPERPENRAGDSESDISANRSQVNRSDVTAYVPEQGPDSGCLDTPRGGDRPNASGPEAAMHTGSPKFSGK